MSPALARAQARYDDESPYTDDDGLGGDADYIKADIERLKTIADKLATARGWTLSVGEANEVATLLRDIVLPQWESDLRAEMQRVEAARDEARIRAEGGYDL